jgi:arylformamidase
MKIIDVSLPITNSLPVWPGDPAINNQLVAQIKLGAECNITQLSFGAHIGTHMDAPCHFLDGRGGIETLNLDDLIGPCYVVELPEDVMTITAEVIEKAHIPAGANRLVFKSRNSRFWDENPARFHTEFTAFEPDAARLLVSRGVRLLALDYLSIAPYQRAVETHQILLGAGVAVVEGLDLRQVSAGYYSILCLPLKLAGSDGAPTRVVLIDEV